MDDGTKTAPRPPVAPGDAPALSSGHVEAVVRMILASLRTVSDGKWEPRSDIPAIAKLLLAAAIAVAASGYGVRELATAYLAVTGAA